MSKLNKEVARRREALSALLREPSQRGAEFDYALNKTITNLAAIDDEFRNRMRSNANEALGELGLKVPAGVRYVGVAEGDRVIPLPRQGLLERRYEDPEHPHPIPRDPAETEEVGEVDPSRKLTPLARIQVSHISTAVFPQGYRGDDTATITMPSGASVGSVLAYRNREFGFADASVSGWSRNGDELAVSVHWWCNGWTSVTYTIEVDTYDAQQRKYGNEFYELYNSTFAPIYLTGTYSRLHSWWDDPTRYW